MRINLIDNNWGDSSGHRFHRNQIAELFSIADKSISKLCDEMPDLLVFPHCLRLSRDRLGDSPILSIVPDGDKDHVAIRTGNVMGFVGLGDMSLKIKSRFDQGREDYLLHYMLQRVMSFNIFNLSHGATDEEIIDMMMLMFPSFLKAALVQGIYREYRRYNHNDANVRGQIDTRRHISENALFNGKIAYATREYSCDNSMLQLIRHTIEFMRHNKFGYSILNVDSETVENVATIVNNTPSYRMGDRNAVIHSNLRSKRHPFYTEYQPLQRLCLQILRKDELKYGDDDNRVCGMLFDGAWLWEEYVNTILMKHGFEHPENKLGQGAKYLFRDEENGMVRFSGRRYPDFYNDAIVLDAKYKRLGECTRVSSVGRNDIHQIMSYMVALDIKRGGFISPLLNY